MFSNYSFVSISFTIETSAQPPREGLIKKQKSPHWLSTTYHPLPLSTLVNMTVVDRTCQHHLEL